MIKTKDLISRHYIKKDCCSFQYILKMQEENPIIVQFERKFENEMPTKFWKLSMIFDNERNLKHCFTAYFEMPKINVPLELVCATGLLQIRYYISSCLEYYSEASIEISKGLEGML